MEMVLNKELCGISDNEMLVIDGGGWLEAGAAFVGTVLIGIAPAVGVATGVAASTATPIVGVAAGIGAYGTVSAAGAACLDFACR